MTDSDDRRSPAARDGTRDEIPAPLASRQAPTITSGPDGHQHGQPASDGAREVGGTPAPLDLVPAMIAATRAITCATDEASLFTAAVESLSCLGHDAFYLSRFCDDANSVLEIVGVWKRGGAPPVPAGTRLQRSAYPGLEKIAAGDPILYEDCATDPRLHETTRRLMVDKMGILSMALFPLMHGDRLLGSLSANYGAPHVYSPEERQLLTLVAQLSAVTLLGIRSRKQIDEKVRLVEALYRAGDAVAVISEEAPLLDRTAELLVNEVGYVISWIGLVDPERGALASRAGLGRNFGVDLSIVHPLDSPRSAAVAAFHQGHPVVRHDLHERREAEAWGEAATNAGLRTGVYVPLRAGGEALGVLGVGSSDERITEDEVALIAAFGNQLAAAILRARRDRERTEQLAQLEQAYDHQARLLEVVRELSTPVIPVHDGILVLPLVGTVDSNRSAQIMGSLLSAIEREQASVVLIDVTGVPMVDTGVADHLLRAVRAAALLGAEVVLVGIAPTVAQTIVQLGVDLSGVTTRGDLQAGIAHALRRRGLEIRPLQAAAAAPPPGAGGARLRKVR
ncbi:GAF domain-containing protein [Sorangium sp. So ce693]|uniref:GAF domain-containing protein n=1 Tax=Sorangium sp. So ce693 TaxID=3133318 RepID=UPI003F62F370